jgi:hypothetical protein
VNFSATNGTSWPLALSPKYDTGGRGARTVTGIPKERPTRMFLSVSTNCQPAAGDTDDFLNIFTVAERYLKGKVVDAVSPPPQHMFVTKGRAYRIVTMSGSEPPPPRGPSRFCLAQSTRNALRFEVLTAMIAKITVCRNVAPCRRNLLLPSSG